jgi:predicted lipid-binding transport protein (Tim44 family)
LASASPYSTPVPVASPTTQQATSSASPNPVSRNDQRSDWSSRIHYYKVWAQLNWFPLLIGGLVFLALLVLVLVGRRSKLQSRDTAEREEKRIEKTTAAAASAEAARPAKAIPPPDATSPTSAAADHKAEVPPKNTTSSSAAGTNAPADEDQEREVFEL